MITAKIVAGSTNPYNDKKLVTYLITYPRIIHSEIMTHKMLNKNAASSRAIPFETKVKMIEDNPFIPIAWQKDHKGMQGTEYSNDAVANDMKDQWLAARDVAVNKAKILSQYGLTKQLCNRLLEPFEYITTLITGTEWENFFALRCPKYYENMSDTYWRSKKDYLKVRNAEARKLYVQECPTQVSLADWRYKEVKEEHYSPSMWLALNKGMAEIHLMDLAEKMWDAYNEFEYKALKPGEWHLPLVNMEDTLTSYAIHDFGITESDNQYDPDLLAAMVATARAARGSYGKWEGKTIKEDLELHNRLWKDGHWSPFAHAAQCPNGVQYSTQNDTKYIKRTNGEGHEVQYGWFSEYHGFMSYRYMLERKLITL